MILDATLVKDIPLKDRPQERIIQRGSGILTDHELIGLILRHGGKNVSVLDLAQKVLREINGLEHLVDVNIGTLSKIPYIGQVQLAKLLALQEIVRRVKLNGTASSKNKISNPSDVYTFIRSQVYGAKKENLFVLIMDSRQFVIKSVLISIGTVSETLIHPREIFKECINANSSGVILVHNHPSGDVTPSDDDITVSKRLMKAGDIVGIPLLDHVIVSDSNYLSMKVAGLIEKGGD